MLPFLNGLADHCHLACAHVSRTKHAIFKIEFKLMKKLHNYEIDFVCYSLLFSEIVVRRKTVSETVLVVARTEGD